MTNIKVEYDAHMYVTRKGDPDDMWDRDSTDGDVYVNGIRVVDDSYRDVSVPFDVDDDHNYYLLYAVYTTGDSFGSDGGNTEWIDLFRTRAAADAAKKSIEETTGSFSASYTRDDGTDIKIHIPWDGYFETLDELTVKKVSTV
jgi:hypothetical protein